MPDFRQDTMSERGASRLAAIIRAYWRKAGYGATVAVWIEPLEGHLKAFVVRSNLSNGRPPR